MTKRKTTIVTTPHARRETSATATPKKVRAKPAKSTATTGPAAKAAPAQTASAKATKAKAATAPAKAATAQAKAAKAKAAKAAPARAPRPRRVAPASVVPFVAERPRRNPAAPLTEEQLRQMAEARHRTIAEAAYLRAEQRGFVPGMELHDWLAAEAEYSIRAEAS